MARLERIRYTPMSEVVEGGEVTWIKDVMGREIAKLPQIFWNSGEPWSEANHWALEKATSVRGSHLKTVTSLMKHLAAYASWLERSDIDWRHFPTRLADRSVFRFRGYLVAERSESRLKPSTVTARMRAVIQFYRHAQHHGFVGTSSPLWTDKQVVVRYVDSVGFERSLLRISTELAIPIRARPGTVLEDGLTPLRHEHLEELLAFTREHGPREIHFMLSIGSLTGARIGTIAGLRVKDIERAFPDSQLPSLYCLPVGPVAGIPTKFGVDGNLLVPDFLLEELKGYAYSMSRMARQAIAAKENRGLLFLTSRGNPYESSSFNRLMTDLRRSTSSRMQFMTDFKFHQTRATYGTWLMELALAVTTEAAAVAFVRDAMLHKNEATTLKYVRFRQNAKVKARLSSAFFAVFSGLGARDWSRSDA